MFSVLQDQMVARKVILALLIRHANTKLKIKYNYPSFTTI